MTAQHLTLSHYPKGSLKYNIFTVVFAHLCFARKTFFYQDLFLDGNVQCARSGFVCDSAIFYRLPVGTSTIHSAHTLTSPFLWVQKFQFVIIINFLI